MLLIVGIMAVNNDVIAIVVDVTTMLLVVGIMAVHNDVMTDDIR